MRASEIFKMKNEDIDFNNGIVHLYDTKNKHSRNVNLGDERFRIIKTYAKMNMAFIFFEKPPRDVSNHFRSAVKEAGLNNGVTDRRNIFVFHSLRHTFASWLAQDGVSIFEIGKVLGHRDISMTMRYAHLAPNHTKPAINKLERDLLSSSKKKVENLEPKKRTKKQRKSKNNSRKQASKEVKKISLNSNIAH